MGLGDFFKRRAQRESAVPDSSTEIQPLGSFASAESQPVIGQQVSGGDPSANLGMLQGMEALTQLGPMIAQAMQGAKVTQNPDGSIEFQGGTVHIQQEGSQVIDMRGSGLREEIVSIMEAHGVQTGPFSSGEEIDAATAPEMQAQILAALAKHGIDPGNAGADPPKLDE